MTKSKLRIGLLLCLLVAVIVGFVYVLYYWGTDEVRDGTLVKENAVYYCLEDGKL